jgi:glycosyltransferase involved in cell wall biosynthesis
VGRRAACEEFQAARRCLRADVAASARVRVLRIIARLNIGGPAHHVSILSGRMDPGRYDTLLLAGALGPGEGSSERLAQLHGARLEYVDGLSPEIAPRADMRALAALMRIMRAFRPHVVDTHTAKAGTLGRLAARLALGPRPIVVHTYHGHVLSGYFGPAETAVYRAIERGLARATDQLVAVSQATADELVGMGVAPADRFVTIPIGLELDAFLTSGRADGAGFREQLGVAPDDVLAVFVGRLAAIKRVDVLLDAVAIARRGGVRLRLAVVGDGELRGELEARTQELGIRDAVGFCGFRTDLAAIAAGTDIAVLSSDNEGTPVALIEAAAAGRPAVSTHVGGVADIVRPETGVLVPPGDPTALAHGLSALAADRDLRQRMGAAARAHVQRTFRAERLIDDMDRLYMRLLARRAGQRSAAA